MALIALVVLALVAAAVWYASGRLHAREMAAPPPEPAPEPASFPLLAVYFTLLIKVAQADGHIGHDELDFARRHLRKVSRVVSGGVLTAADVARLEETILRRGHELSLPDTAALVRSAWTDLAPAAPAEAFFEEALTALASVASLDGTLAAREDEAIAQVAEAFGVPEARYAALRAVVIEELAPRAAGRPAAGPGSDESDFDPAPADEPTLRRRYGAVLGLQGRLTKADVRRRYRELLALYHPDKVAHLGPELRALAEQKTKEINEAYGWLARRHGL